MPNLGTNKDKNQEVRNSTERDGKESRYHEIKNKRSGVKQRNKEKTGVNN